LPPECFTKLYFMFLNMEFNKNELEVDKWEIEINELMEYKYMDNIWIINVIKVI